MILLPRYPDTWITRCARPSGQPVAVQRALRFCPAFAGMTVLGRDRCHYINCDGMLVTTDIPLAGGSCTLMQGYIDKTRADRLFTSLCHNLAWTQPEVFLFGRKILSPRLAAWYGDADAVYKYSGLVNKPMPWTPELSEIRQQLVASCGMDFNSVLANLYRNGNDAMGWHSDDEVELGAQPVIASISLGASRRFLLRHKTDRSQKTVRLELDHGALLLMRDDTQRNWKHAVPRTRRNVGERINLTFRYIYPDRSVQTGPG